MVFEKKMSVKDLIEQMREELKKEQDEISPRKTITKVKTSKNKTTTKTKKKAPLKTKKKIIKKKK
ncbi:MAG: hypothetical protein PHY04_02965 [Candidatus ainarchaeum sp.]|jgi:predicted flavoprotein YhiN|nr:hypothetical protein [Candidatus ainarchaeum sp.]MDD3085712.1 hypothetical protein [Candidatus ainarchaeum sp.]MDD4128671.1 hypothetical protein [Candidatus ainarchaeum sp.]MDD4467830.1 hypothetical protein [Candidatus ainarchaeum sp.]HPM85804.1 hypothetical protein [archaeon]